MTKIKNTKKGMAKKTLSMSLVVAMLATSNVPVWAAEFSDGSDVAVATEAPAEFADETEAPVVEDATVDTAAATTVSINAKIKESGWGTAATVDLKGFTAGALASTDNINYIWKVNGLEVASGTVAATEANLKALTYTPAMGDCGGELQLFLSYTDPNEEDSDKNFTWESNKVTVSKHDISNDGITVTMKATGPKYDGKNHNDASKWVENYDALVAAGYDVSVITDKDFVNADSKITAKVTPKDTAHYQGEVTSATTASIAKSTAIDKLKVEYVGSGYTYTRSEIALKASDFKLTDTLSGEVLDSSKYIDLANSANAKATDAGEYEVTIKTKDLVNYVTGAQDVKAVNKWKIEKADLSKCTVFLGEISEQATPILASDLKNINVSDGTHTLYNGAISASDFVIGNVQANTGSVGTYTATVQTKANSKNFTGTTTTATFRVVRNALSKAQFKGTSTEPNYATDKENYTGEAVTKDTKKLGDLVILDGAKEVKLTAGVDYDPTFVYSNNTNAGTASFTVTGKGSFEGSKLVVSFPIKAAHVTNNGDMVSNKVGFVEDSTRKASDYKSGITVNVKAENDDKKAFTLVEGTDYKVDYSYKETTGNALGNHIVVKITLLNNNFGAKGTEYSEEVALTKKQISSVTVTPVQSSYTYTGAAIVPELIVKDGETELSKGEDYVVKSVSNNKNVGTATIVIAGATNSDYDVDSTAKATFTITPANTSDLVVNVADQDYTGTKKKPTLKDIEIKLNGVTITDKFIVSYPTSAEANRQVGTGTLTLTPDNGNKNFTGTKEVSFNIVGKKLAFNASVGDKFEVYKADGTKDTNTAFTYDGTAHTYAKAVATIFDGSKKLVEGTDYEIKYFHNVSGTGDGSTGTAYVAVVGKGNYAGNGSYNITDENGKTVNCIVNKSFTINRLQLVKQCVAIKDAEYAEGLPVKPQVTVTYGGNVLTEGTDYKLDIPTVTTITSKEYKATVTGKNGYYDSVANLSWKVTKKDLANCDVTATKDASGALSVTVMNGSVKVPAAKYVAKENADGTVTVTPAKDSKYYTGSKTVALAGDKTKVGTPVISSVKVVGNKATVILSGEADGASGYDYVISKANDTTTARVDVTKNQVKTTGDFNYVQQGTYYAYCHAWTRNAEGKKVFGEWSNIYPFSVSAITPAQPVITSVKAKGTTVTVTYTKAANAEGYDVVLGSAAKKVNGEYRPVSYGKLVKKNIKGNVVTATFKNVEKGTYYAGLHAFNKTSEDGKKVFSQWSNVKKVTVK